MSMTSPSVTAGVRASDRAAGGGRVGGAGELFIDFAGFMDEEFV